MTDRLWAAEDVAEFLGVPRKTVYVWSSNRTGPPSLKVGRHLRFRRADVEAWLDTKATNSQGAA